MSIFLSYGSGIVTLILSWFLLKDLIYASICVLIFSSLFLYLYGPNPIAFSLCLCNGWILLNKLVERLFPLND
ncbi:MAG: hypothetical protein DBX07_01145 [Candidatus Poseidoniales archaeon]|jgi:hypothetical protein|nr:hypothetical protein [Euryarchaeota archaeon]MDA7602918.1 hypothetical protein [Euryarchaeota archaeon]MDC0555903.1 hypothetical protein [Euryarchaeota archaeon]OUX47030.1 MAG: hypothetical protein CBE40_01090 [Euryarchaeota archaeon TMED280]RCH76297.1 MAG: hypothetical protein DBX07_01145 [Candidatus Poseidoniales archaeon]